MGDPFCLCDILGTELGSDDLFVKVDGTISFAANATGTVADLVYSGYTFDVQITDGAVANCTLQ
jgi:hypothetical protein